MSPRSGTLIRDDPDDRADPSTVIFGAGPAGLTAAWELIHNDVPVQVLEAEESIVGGIARTASYKGFRFDIGGHRFFTKAEEVKKLWHQILSPDDWLTVPRLSRIYYKGKFFAYPLKPFDALAKLGVTQTALCLLSYARYKVSPLKTEDSLESWVINRFGRRLYEVFFKTYTEKVWGIPCDQISADWAAQRIKGLSLIGAIRNAFSKGGQGKNGDVVKTLIEEFEYPKLGPGMMWDRAKEKVELKGAEVHMGSPVAALKWGGGRLLAAETAGAGGPKVFQAANFISTLPIRELIGMLEPEAPGEVRRAANALSYRDFLTVVLIVNEKTLFPDNWIYIHDPSVKLGRVQNFKNWSPEMVPDASKTALGLEYFCNEGDELWEMSEADLIALGSEEISKLGLCKKADVEDGTVVRMKKTYPVYDEHYEANVNVIRKFLDQEMPNLQLVGRNGMHKYNNQDHSMMTALLAAKNILGESWDPWNVNTDAEYHEEHRPDHNTAARSAPRALKS